MTWVQTHLARLSARKLCDYLHKYGIIEPKIKHFSRKLISAVVITTLFLAVNYAWVHLKKKVNVQLHGRSSVGECNSAF